MKATGCKPGVSTGTGLVTGYELSFMAALDGRAITNRINRNVNRRMGMYMSVISFS
jgi:hypothetical protein